MHFRIVHGSLLQSAHVMGDKAENIKRKRGVGLVVCMNQKKRPCEEEKMGVDAVVITASSI